MGLEAAAKAWARTGQALPTPSPVPPSRRSVSAALRSSRWQRRLDLLAHQLGKSRSACIREAISQYLLRYGDDGEARRQSQLLAELEAPNWSEQLPDWSDWTA
jgi:predicted transcriptional regulator